MINHLGGIFGVFTPAAAEFAHGAHLVFVFAVVDKAKAGIHAPIAHHASGQIGGLANVAAGAGIDITAEHFLGNSAAEEGLHGGYAPRPRIVGAVFFGQRHGGAAIVTAGDDGYLVDRVGVFAQVLHNGVPGFVVCGGDLVFLVDDAAFSGPAPAHLVARFFEVILLDTVFGAHGGRQG